MAWWDTDILVLDTETTGRDPRSARIVTVCLALLRPDGSVGDSLEILVNPGVEIPEGATAVHGITNEMAAAGQDPADAVKRVTNLLVGHMGLGTYPVVAMNARYDFTVLDRECRRYDLETLTDALDGRVQPVLDPYVLDKAVDQYRKGSRTLTDLCDHYGVPLDDAHDAKADAVAAGRLTQALVMEYRGLQLPLEQLHRAQEIWARQQAQSLQRHLRQKHHDDTIVCEPEWPIIPFEEEA